MSNDVIFLFDLYQRLYPVCPYNERGECKGQPCIMHDNELIRPDTLVDDLLTAYPQAAEVFVNRAMMCVGCTISSFHTLAEAAAVYHLNLDAFLAELRDRITVSVQSGD